MLYQLSYLPTRRVRIADVSEGVYFPTDIRGLKRRYSTDETTPRAPDFSK